VNGVSGVGNFREFDCKLLKLFRLLVIELNLRQEYHRGGVLNRSQR
jgi:hypothetical protein